MGIRSSLFGFIQSVFPSPAQEAVKMRKLSGAASVKGLVRATTTPPGRPNRFAKRTRLVVCSRFSCCSACKSITTDRFMPAATGAACFGVRFIGFLAFRAVSDFVRHTASDNRFSAIWSKLLVTITPI